MKAIWNNTVIAERNKIKEVEGNIYFPPEDVHMQYLKKSWMKSLCFWKGLANYYDVEIKGKINKNAAWYYPHPSPLAKGIKNYVAFWNGVEIIE